MPDPHAETSQDAVFAALADPASHGGTAPVERIDTHGAVVFLAGPDVYKVKRAVRFPFLDYSTLAKRKAACEAEIAVNRGNAPEIYLGVVPITREGGRLRLGGSGAPVEWAVHMRRFDERRTFDRLAAAGALGEEAVRRLAATIAAAHAAGPVVADPAAAQDMAELIEQNGQGFFDHPALFPAAAVERLLAGWRAVLARLSPLLERRRAEGRVRRCHGDLHLRNIVLIGERPVLFDAIEFDPRLASIDVLYDLAFLVMDLCERGLRGAANLVLNRWLVERGDPGELDGLAALGFFTSMRAGIRAKVTAAALPHLSGAEAERMAEEARRYFAAAQRLLAVPPPVLVAIGGLSGTGKSTVAAALAAQLGPAWGAVHLRSDVVRKQRLGAREHERLGADAYGPAADEAAYAALREQAGRALAAGQSVVVDAVHARPAERDAVEAVARRAGASFAGVWLEAPTPVRLERVAGRSGDASDAGPAVAAAQAAYEIGPLAWIRLDASRPVAETVEALRLRLQSAARAATPAAAEP